MDASRLSDIAKRSWRLLRTVAASFSLVACLLFVALWVDSYREESLVFAPTTLNEIYWAAGRDGGVMVARVYRPGARERYGKVGWKYSRISLEVARKRPAAKGIGGFVFSFTDSAQKVGLPCWFLILFSAALALVLKPKPRFQFGIGDLVTFTTVAAVTAGGLAAFYRAYSV